MESHNRKNNDPDRIRKENEEKKMKLTNEFGAHFSGIDGEESMPAEIERLFLDNVMAFEDAWQTANRIPLYDFLKKPGYRKVEELATEEIPGQLERLLNLMDDCQICLDTLCDVEDRELYRFITEELFFEEVDDIHIPGMMCNFIYEEFHPNHEYDIRNHSLDFIRSYLDKENDFYIHLLTTEAEKDDWHIHFRNAFSGFQLNAFEITGLNFDTQKSTVQFHCDLIAKVTESDKSFRFLGPGEIQLLCQWDFWSVDKLKLPQGVVC